VHRYADFADAGYLDFIVSAAAIAPVLQSAPTRRVGQTVLEAIRATRNVTGTNTNLGIILLLAPLATVPDGTDLQTGLRTVLESLDVGDARHVYEAIRLANPGGMGQVAEQDVQAEPTLSLREVMALAADRDLIARQYIRDFGDIFHRGLPALQKGIAAAGSLEVGIIACHLDLLAAGPDSLIARKCGLATAVEASQRAAQVLAAGWPGTAEGRGALTHFDDWLRADGHRRNPGTTADLVTASLFVALRTGVLPLPAQVPWLPLLGE
jgi:triphosphoribosyl-dephospho-CoA synthase